MATGDSTITITTPSGKVVRVEHDLAFGVVADIATRHEVHWMVLLGSPLASPAGALLDLYKAALDSVGEPVPDPLPARAIFNAVGTTPDDLPAWYEDGAPKTEQQATT